MNALARFEKAIGDWLAEPEVLRDICAELRTFAPIVTLGKRVFVFRYDDVVEVLGNDRSFGVTAIYAAKMARTTGAFFLGMEDTPQYRREVAIARAAARPDDAGRIAAIVADEVQTLLERAAAAGGVFDAVTWFSRRIPMRLLESYFGTPGPDPDAMKGWMRSIFWDIFLNPNDDATVRDAAGAASAQLAPYLRDLLAARRSAGAPGSPPLDDFVARLLAQQAADPAIDDDLLRRNIGGIIVGAVDTQSKAIAQSLDQLLRRPDALESARRAAAAGDDARVAAHVFEALRFNPHNPALYRSCTADTVIADDTSRRTLVHAGSTVVPMTLSAMFDPDAIERPDEFRVDRPWSAYLHFGRGQHTCFGEHINRVVVPLAVKALLQLENLEYSEKGSGAIEYEGPFPDRMLLAFDVPR